MVQDVSDLVVCGPRLRVLFEGRHLLENLVVSVFCPRQVQHLLDAGLGGTLRDAFNQTRDGPALGSRHGFDPRVLARMGGVPREVSSGVRRDPARGNHVDPRSSALENGRQLQG